MDSVTPERAFALFEGIAKGGTAGSIVKVALAVLFFVGIFLLKHWVEKKKAAMAQAQTEAQRVKDQTDVVTENQEVATDAHAAEDEIRGRRS